MTTTWCVKSYTTDYGDYNRGTVRLTDDGWWTATYLSRGLMSQEVGDFETLAEAQAAVTAYHHRQTR